MKSLFLILAIIGVLSNAYCTFTHKKNNEKTNEKKMLIKYAKNIMHEIDGEENEGKILECMPKTWIANVKSTEITDSMKTIQKAHNVLESIKKTLDDSIERICKENKKDVIDFLKQKVNARRRMFLAKKTRKEYGTFDKLGDNLKSLYERMVKIYSSPLLIKTNDFLHCMKKQPTATSKSKYFLTNYFSDLEKMRKGLSTFIGVQIDLMCAWKPYRDALDSYNTGHKAKENNIKLENYGKFIGKIINIVGA